MSLIDKAKKVRSRAAKAASEEYKKQKENASVRKERRLAEAEAARQARAVAVAKEEERKQKILQGQIDPVAVSVNLGEGEYAYLCLTASRMASVDSVIEHTQGNAKKKHVAGRALVGGVLLGPLGALGGAASAGSKTSSTTTHTTVSSIKEIDRGQLLLTNKRFLFIGENGVVSVDYGNILAAGFNNNAATIKYPEMEKGEYYTLAGPAASDAGLYYASLTAGTS